MLDTRHLAHLVALSEQRHFGKAARVLGISQSALSKSLQRLEHAVGGRLLDRNRKQVVPTALGQVVLDHARRILAEMVDLQHHVERLLGAAAGTISVGIGPALGESFAATAVARMAERHPSIRIRVRNDHWEQLTRWLVEGELDLFVADITQLQGDRRFQVIELPTEQFVWFCRRGHPLAQSRRVTRADMLAFPLATPRMPQWATEWFAAAEAVRGETLRPGPFETVECESYSILKRIVLASHCISAALPSTIAAELAAGDLVALPIESSPLTTNAGIVTLRDRTPSPAAEILMRLVLEMAGQRGQESLEMTDEP